MTHTQIGILILRLSLAGVFLWFGFNQLFDGLSWVGIVPEWASNLLHLPPAMIVLGNGAVEVVLGTLLALGIWIRPISLLLSAKLLVTALGFGLTPVGVRDLGLTLATFSLFFLGKKE